MVDESDVVESGEFEEMLLADEEDTGLALGVALRAVPVADVAVVEGSASLVEGAVRVTGRPRFRINECTGPLVVGRLEGSFVGLDIAHR